MESGKSQTKAGGESKSGATRDVSSSAYRVRQRAQAVHVADECFCRLARRQRTSASATEQSRRTNAVPWALLSDTGSATVPAMAPALMLAACRLLASTGRSDFGPGALAGVERAVRAMRGGGVDRTFRA